MSIKGKVIAVSGASGNLGQACVEAARAAGAKVATIDRSDRGNVAADENVLHLTGIDLGDPDSPKQAIADVLDRFGRLDAVLNTVGGFAMGSVADTDISEWEKLHAMNCVTAVNLTRAAVPTLRAGGGGAIIHVGALAAFSAPANLGAYAASKAALHRLVEAAAAELRADGIRVNAVLPSTIDTPQNRQAMPKADTSKWVSPGAIAEAMLMLADDAARAVTGALIPVTGCG
ncbi:SDR family oxidoreductase [Nisaea sediminum]|uniref:SDR family oxidoreductase n=1 Tax=Nisaea sediminum TaxID=2775867 RepID=UPI001D0323A3|nr:SDR family oxidoreductase [Nisaea sediminum]